MPIAFFTEVDIQCDKPMTILGQSKWAVVDGLWWNETSRAWDKVLDSGSTRVFAARGNQIGNWYSYVTTMAFLWTVTNSTLSWRCNNVMQIPAESILQCKRQFARSGQISEFRISAPSDAASQHSTTWGTCRLCPLSAATGSGRKYFCFWQFSLKLSAGDDKKENSLLKASLVCSDIFNRTLTCETQAHGNSLMSQCHYEIRSLTCCSLTYCQVSPCHKRVLLNISTPFLSQARVGGGTIVQVPCTGHPTHSTPADYGTGTDTGL